MILTTRTTAPSTSICKTATWLLTLGRDEETWKHSFEKVNVDMAANIAKAASEAGVERLYHFSCVGAARTPPERSSAPSTKARSRSVSIFRRRLSRMAPVVGVEDRLLNSIAFMTRRMPYVPLYDGGETKMQPVYVLDVVKAFVETLKHEGTKGQTFEFAGPETYTMKELVTLVEKTIREPSGSLNIPSSLEAADSPRAALQASILSQCRAHTMLTSDYIDGMESDLVVDGSSLGFEDLGIEPQRIDQGVPIEHVRFWRSGGYDFGSTFE